MTVAARKITAEPKTLIIFTQVYAEQYCEENSEYIQCGIWENIRRMPKSMALFGQNSCRTWQ
jgi:hypothetical protein